MEIRQERDEVRHHDQKVPGIFAAMRDSARQLDAAGQPEGGGWNFMMTIHRVATRRHLREIAPQPC